MEGDTDTALQDKVGESPHSSRPGFVALRMFTYGGVPSTDRAGPRLWPSCSLPVAATEDSRQRSISHPQPPCPTPLRLI